MKERKLVNCRFCKHHSYDWYIGDGEEYEVCEKGHELYPLRCRHFRKFKW